MQDQDEKKYHCQKMRKLRAVSGQGKDSSSLRLPSTWMKVFAPLRVLFPHPLLLSLSFSFSLSSVRVGNSRLPAVDESIASPVPESVAAATAAAKPRASKGGGSSFPAQGNQAGLPLVIYVRGAWRKRGGRPGGEVGRTRDSRWSKRQSGDWRSAPRTALRCGGGGMGGKRTFRQRS